MRRIAFWVLWLELVSVSAATGDDYHEHPSLRHPESQTARTISISSLSVPQSALSLEQQIEDATRLLESVGVTSLCHPWSQQYAPFLPLCGIADFRPGDRDRGLLEQEEEDPRVVNVEDHGEEKDAWFYVKDGLLAGVCVVVAALAAGLTMGLLSLDPMLLLIKIRAGATEEERNQAKALLPLVQQHHRLLVTLLLLNSIANEALPLFLDALVPSYMAVILSVTLVLFFGEIIPSALFTGPRQIQIASRLVPLVKVVMMLLYPIAHPIAKALDLILHDDENDDGHNTGAFNRKELSALVRIQYEERLAFKKRRTTELAKLGGPATVPITTSTNNTATSTTHFGQQQQAEAPLLPLEHVGGLVFSASHGQSHRSERSLETTASIHAYRGAPSIHVDEVTMVEGALHLKTKRATDIYTPLSKVFCVPQDCELDEATMIQIYRRGYSRIPVYHQNPKHDNHDEEEEDKGNICGILLTKQLIVLNSTDRRRVGSLSLQQPVCVGPGTNLVDLINIFQQGGSSSKGGHLALVCARPDIATHALHQQTPIPPTAGVMGILTMEDVLEELIQEQIYDEMDKEEKHRARRAVWAMKKWKMFVKKQKIRRDQGDHLPTHNFVTNGNEAKMRSIVLAATEVAAAQAAGGMGNTHTFTVEAGTGTTVTSPLLSKNKR